MPTKSSVTKVAIYSGKHYTMSMSDGGGHVYVRSPWGTVPSLATQRAIIVAIGGGTFKRLPATSGKSGENVYMMFTADYRGNEVAVKQILAKSGAFESTGYEPKASGTKVNTKGSRSVEVAKPAAAKKKTTQQVVAEQHTGKKRVAAVAKPSAKAKPAAKAASRAKSRSSSTKFGSW